MPPIDDYKCNKCGLSLPSGWGGYIYVIDGSGKRIVCPHPVGGGGSQSARKKCFQKGH